MSNDKPEVTPESGLDALYDLSWADFKLRQKAHENIIREVFEGASCSDTCSDIRKVTVADVDAWVFQFVLAVDPTAYVLVKTVHDYTSFFVLADKEASVRNVMKSWGVKSF